MCDLGDLSFLMHERTLISSQLSSYLPPIIHLTHMWPSGSVVTVVVSFIYELIGLYQSQTTNPPPPH